MIRALCPVCNTPQPLTTHHRIQPHRRKTESPLVRDKYGHLGVPCEGTGRLPTRRTPNQAPKAATAAERRTPHS